MPPTVESAPPRAAVAPAVDAASVPTVYPAETHTCAPWEIEDDGVSSGKLIRIVHVEHDADENGGHVAYVTHVADIGDCQEEAANARLIAAAPELLAALREIADDHCECEGPNEATEFRGRVCQFHAAIAKAEGQS